MSVLRLAMLVATASALLSPAEAQPPMTESGIRLETADRELLVRLARENAVTTSVPHRGAMDYLAHLGERLMGWLLDLLRPLGSYAARVGATIGGAVGVVAVLAAVLLLLLAGRILFRSRRRRAPPSPTTLLGGESESKPELRDDAAWRKELQERIESADVRGALEALWWWVARSVLGSRVRESWTSVDVLSTANRPGLSRPVRQLERMMYGSRKPSLDEVRELVRSLEQQLA